MAIVSEAAVQLDEFLTRQTQTGSAEANVQALVRRAYRVTVQDLHGQVLHGVASAWQRAAEMATGGEITRDVLRTAARTNEGL